MSEIDVLKAVDDALRQAEDSDVRDRVLRWAWEKYSTKPALASGSANLPSGRKNPSGKKTTSGSKSKNKARTSPSIVRDLNLKPKGRTSFDDFAASKRPETNGHKCVVSVYYVHHELGIEQVGVNHVLTCFKHMKWRVPSDLPNTLSYTASKNGWLDTGNMQDIKITSIGENLIEHDLPTAQAEGEKN